MSTQARTHTHILHMQTQRHKDNRNTICSFKTHPQTHTRGQQNHINNETLIKIHECLQISLQKLKWPISWAIVIIIHSHRDTRLSQTCNATFSDALCISPNRLVVRFFSAKYVYERAQNHWLGAYACVFWVFIPVTQIPQCYEEEKGSCLYTFNTAFKCFIKTKKFYKM